jgi:ethanolamine ammonia-lyase large subunit
MAHHQTVGTTSYAFEDLKTVLARASPFRSGDVLAGVAARDASERVAAQRVLAELPLRAFLSEPVLPYESDDVTRLILDGHNAQAFAPVAHLTVGEFRDWLLSDAVGTETLSALAPGLTPEMAAAVSKVMRLQDLVLVAAKCEVVSRFRNTLGIRGRISTRLPPMTSRALRPPSWTASSSVPGTR